MKPAASAPPRMERYEHLSNLEARLYAAVPPVDPEPLHWLFDDASASYCYEHAREALLKAKGLSEWPVKPTGYSWEHTPEQEAAIELAEQLEDGIDGGGDSSPSDHSEACDTCGCTLRHTLTDYGVEQELAHFAENPGFEVLDAEQSYVVSRICMNLTWPGAPAEQVEAAIKIVEDALEAVEAGRVASSPQISPASQAELRAPGAVTSPSAPGAQPSEAAR